MLFVGIDPGKNGGIAWRCAVSNDYGAIPMPDSIAQTYAFLEELKFNYGVLRVYIEAVQVMGKVFGAKAALSYGKGYGEIIGALTALKAEIVEIHPAVWKRKLNVSADKNSSILLCEKLFPEINLKPGRRTKCHDGIAEAALIMRYGEVMR